MNTFTRTIEGAPVTTLNLTDAVEQFIRDNHAYALADGTLDEEDDVQDWLDDMVTVFETQDMLRLLDIGEELTSGIATFKRIA
jgi:hypothetical protein